jgi:ubiquinone/menaquinone biosynthesis C-methylase UbiE
MANEERFSGLAEQYKTYRPSYAAESIDYVIQNAGVLQGAVVADIGSGTGILSELFLERGFRVYGVEPNEDMRSVAETQLSKKYANFASIPGTAENTGLSDCSVSLVTVSQALHWFDRKKFAAECRRILRPEGKLAVFYADFNRSSGMFDDLRDLNRTLFGNKQWTLSVAYAYSASNLRKLFRNGEYAEAEFDNAKFYDKEAFLSFVLTYSFAPKPHEAEYGAYSAAVENIFEKHAVSLRGGVHITRAVKQIKAPFMMRTFVGTV